MALWQRRHSRRKQLKRKQELLKRADSQSQSTMATEPSQEAAYNLGAFGEQEVDTKRENPIDFMDMHSRAQLLIEMINNSSLEEQREEVINKMKEQIHEDWQLCYQHFDDKALKQYLIKPLEEFSDNVMHSVFSSVGEGDGFARKVDNISECVDIAMEQIEGLTSERQQPKQHRENPPINRDGHFWRNAVGKQVSHSSGKIPGEIEL